MSGTEQHHTKLNLDFVHFLEENYWGRSDSYLKKLK